MSPGRPRRLQDRDVAEQAQLLKLALWLYPTAVIMLGVLALMMREQEWISPLAFRIILVVNIPLAGVIVLAVWFVVGRAAEGLAQVVYAGGNIKPEISFSLEDSMIARGEFEAARVTFEARLTGGTEDTAVRLRLAELHTRHLRQPAEAIRWLQEARRGPCDDRQQAAVANGLIDLYRATGERGRLMVELARFAELYPNTRAGADAREELRRLKTETP